MSDGSWQATNTPERRAAYAKLVEVVEEMSRLDEKECRCERSMPTSWVLVVGYEDGRTVEDVAAREIAGEEEVHANSIGVYPKDGIQPNWKILGLLQETINTR